MPTVYSVSDITNILSTIIQAEQTLRKVRVQGRVSVDGPESVFFLSHGVQKIRCFIPNNKVAIFSPLLAAGNTVIVNGNIQIFPAFSEYQIRVENVQPLKAFGKNPPSTVSEITKTLSDIIKNSSELTEIHIRGEVSESARQPGTIFWFLKDIGNLIPAAAGWQQIHCVRFDNGLIGDKISVTDGNEIQTTGKIQIWGAQSRYQINVTYIKPDDSTEQCQCSECAQCAGVKQCNRPREIANFESCATCLPRPPDELYELCRECYAVSPDHETKVTEAVYAYFNKFQVNGFSPDKKCQIQFGTRNGIADVALTDVNGSFAVIAECKGAGYVGHGIEQLQSYLSATDTRFGVFANRADPSQWKFYENRRRNQFDQIDRSEFEMGVVERVVTRERLKDEIKALEKVKDDLGGKKSELETEIAQHTQTDHDLQDTHKRLITDIGKKRVQQGELETEIGKLEEKKRELQAAREQRKEKIQQFEKILAELKSEVLDLPLLPEDKDHQQKSHKGKSQGIKNWFKNLFSKEKE